MQSALSGFGQRTVECLELLLDVRVTLSRLQEAVWLGKITHASQEVCQIGSRSLGSWPSGLKEEGHLVRWALGPVLVESRWGILVNHRGESQNEAVKEDRTLVSELKDRLRRLDLEKWEEQWRLSQKSQGILWAGDSRTVEGRQGPGLAG